VKSLVYFLYGEKREYHLELTYSVLTAYNFIRNSAADTKIVLVTEEPTRRDDLPVDHLFFTRSDYNKWTGNGDYVHAAKIQSVAMAMDYTKGPIVYVDTDTWFMKSPALLFDRVGPGRSIMHERHGYLRDDDLWKPFLASGKASVAGYAVGPDSKRWCFGDRPIS
jgi:hypothetical protein